LADVLQKANETVETSYPEPPEFIEQGDRVLVVGEAALSHLSDDARKEESFQLALGRAQIRSGSKDKGAATLQALLKQSQSPATLNSAAFELADASLDLADAESATRSALDKLSEESREMNLDADAKKIAEQKRLVAATWDTMGWILFREGKIAEAESYLRAAWNAEQNLEIRKHLTALASAQGRKPQLDYIHQIELGSSNGRNGVDEYRLLLRGGKATEIKPVGATTISNALAMIAKAKFIDLFPSGSQITLIRLGYLNCHDRVCELILEP
jgi:tetratricopeptide (TPR) repeat protein